MHSTADTKTICALRNGHKRNVRIAQQGPTTAYAQHSSHKQNFCTTQQTQTHVYAQVNRHKRRMRSTVATHNSLRGRARRGTDTSSEQESPAISMTKKLQPNITDVNKKPFNIVFIFVSQGCDKTTIHTCH